MWPNDLLREPLGLPVKKRYRPLKRPSAKEPVSEPEPEPEPGTVPVPVPVPMPVTAAPVISQNIYNLIEKQDYRRAAKEIVQDFFNPSHRYRSTLEAEVKFILERTEGLVVAMPATKQLPLLLRHYHLKKSKQSKVFYYLLWYMDDVKKHGGRFSIVQCLNGPYRGQHFSRLDEAMRVNVIWAWATTDEQFRPSSLAMGQNPKLETFALTREGVWRQLKSLKFENLPESLCSVRNDGFSVRADQHPYPVFLPNGCRGTAEEFVDNLWSQEHLSWKAVGPTGDVPCVCPLDCYHPPIGSISSREHIVPVLCNPNDPYSKCVQHCRCLRGQPYWVEHLSDNPYDNWHNAVAYTVSKVYTY